MYQIIGINHRTANAALLGLVSLNGQRREVFLKKINENTAFDGFVLSTCNRTEVYFITADPQGVLAAWAEAAGLEKLPTGKFYSHTGTAVVEHLCRVACGLDSKILGDNEILGQLKEAIQFQKATYGLDCNWERLLSTTVECSRRVRRETDLNKGSISTPYRIAKIIQKETSSDEPVLLIGAGEMVKLCLKYLKKVLPDRQLYISNRSIEKAKLLAGEFGAAYFHFGQLETEMRHFGTIISAIQVDKPFFRNSFLNENEPQLLFDLGIPRNFTTEVSSQHHYFDVNTIAEFNAAALEHRAKEVERVEAIIAEKVAIFKGKTAYQFAWPG